MFFLENRVGRFLYHLLPNYTIWRLLSPKERATVLMNNIVKNNLTYKDAAKYSEDHLQIGDPLETTTGQFIARWVLETKPYAVLEIGPGGGFYTQVLFTASSVAEYHAIDCVARFLEIVQEMVSAKYPTVKVRTYNHDFLTFGDGLRGGSYDLILCSGFLHHVPQRVEHALAFHRLLKPGGIVIAVEMTHYLPRLKRLLQLYLPLLWRGTARYIGPGKPCTHHGLTLSELTQISKNSNLSLEFVSWDARYHRNSLMRFRSSVVYFVLKKCTV